MKKIPKQYYFELAIFCAHYHSGQWSRGYRLLSKLRATWNSGAEQEATEHPIYQYLVENYSKSV